MMFEPTIRTTLLIIIIFFNFSKKVNSQDKHLNSITNSISGLSITNTTNISGSPSNINIRGMSSLTLSNQPLIIVDGVEFNSSTLNESGNFWDGITSTSRLIDIDPSIIVDVKILKSINQTIIYGNRGRNGVILITTTNGVKSNSKRKKKP